MQIYKHHFEKIIQQKSDLSLQQSLKIKQNESQWQDFPWQDTLDPQLLLQVKEQESEIQTIINQSTQSIPSIP